MKIFISVLILILSFQSLSKGDDIRDFEIEGMSIGDSALDYFTDSEINSYGKVYYKDKKYFEITLKTDDSIYDSISLTFNSNDKKYIMEQVFGTLIFKNFEACKKRKNDMVQELDEMFTSAEKVDAGLRDYAADPSGNSKTDSVYYLINGAFIELSCYNVESVFAKKKKLV